MILFVSAFFHPGVHLVIRRYEKYGVNRKISWVWNNYSRFHKTTYFVLRNDKNAFCLKKRGGGIETRNQRFRLKRGDFFSFRIHEKGCFLNFWMDVRFGLEVGGGGGDCTGSWNHFSWKKGHVFPPSQYNWWWRHPALIINLPGTHRPQTR